MPNRSGGPLGTGLPAGAFEEAPVLPSACPSRPLRPANQAAVPTRAKSAAASSAPPKSRVRERAPTGGGTDADGGGCRCADRPPGPGSRRARRRRRGGRGGAGRGRNRRAPPCPQGGRRPQVHLAGRQGADHQGRGVLEGRHGLVDGRSKGAGVPIASVPVGRHGLTDDGIEGHGHLRSDLPRRRRVPRQDLLVQILRCTGREGQPPRDHAVEQHAHGVEVAARVQVRLPAHLLG